MDVEGAVAEAFAAAGGAGDDGADAPVTTEAPAAEGTAEATPQGDAGTSPDDEGGDAAAAAPAEAEAEGAEGAAADGKPALPGRITVAKHQRILENQRAEANQRIQALESENQQLAWAKNPEVLATFQALQVAETNPRAFVNGLAQDPRYAALFKEMFGGGAGAPAAGAAGAAPASGKLPDPDVLHPDGSVGYSAEKVQQILDAREQAIEQKFSKLLDERTKPIEPVIQAHRHQVAWNQALESQGKVLDRARKNWAGFTDHEAEIRQKFMEHLNDPDYRLDDAYREVVFTKFQADRNKVRAETIAEINSKAKAAVPAPGSAAPVASAGPRSVSDIVAEQFAAARSAA